MAQLESQNAREDGAQEDGSPKYMPSTDDKDPIVKALKSVLKCTEVTGKCQCEVYLAKSRKVLIHKKT